MVIVTQSPSLDMPWRKQYRTIPEEAEGDWESLQFGWCFVNTALESKTRRYTDFHPSPKRSYIRISRHESSANDVRGPVTSAIPCGSSLDVPDGESSMVIADADSNCTSMPHASPCTYVYSEYSGGLGSWIPCNGPITRRARDTAIFDSES